MLSDINYSYLIELKTLCGDIKRCKYFTRALIETGPPEGIVHSHFIYVG
jgi:hypothetical protein